jgi:capsular polysaccharide biosynthesis protein
MRIPSILRSFHIAPYLRYLRLAILFALIPAVVAGATGYYRGHQGTPTYSASATLYVQQSAQGTLGSSGIPDVGSSTALAQTYASLATQPIIQRNADRLLAKKYPGYRLEANGLSSSTGTLQQQTPVIVLTVTDTIPRRAADAANAASQAFIAQVREVNRSQFAADDRSLNQALAKEKSQIDAITAQISGYGGSATGLDVLKATLGAHESTYQALLSSSEQLKLAADESSSNVDLYSPADVPVTPNGLHPLRNAATWFLIALLLGGALIYGYEYLNDLPHEMEARPCSEPSPGLPKKTCTCTASHAAASRRARRNPTVSREPICSSPTWTTRSARSS